MMSPFTKNSQRSAGHGDLKALLDFQVAGACVASHSFDKPLLDIKILLDAYWPRGRNRTNRKRTLTVAKFPKMPS